jgi:hypothetical protein
VEGPHPPGISVSNERRILPSHANRKPHLLYTLAGIKPYFDQSGENCAPKRQEALTTGKADARNRHAVVANARTWFFNPAVQLIMT